MKKTRIKIKVTKGSLRTVGRDIEIIVGYKSRYYPYGNNDEFKDEMVDDTEDLLLDIIDVFPRKNVFRGTVLEICVGDFFKSIQDFQVLSVEEIE